MNCFGLGNVKFTVHASCLRALHGAVREAELSTSGCWTSQIPVTLACNRKATGEQRSKLLKRKPYSEWQYRCCRKQKCGVRKLAQKCAWGASPKVFLLILHAAGLGFKVWSFDPKPQIQTLRFVQHFGSGLCKA